MSNNVANELAIKVRERSSPPFFLRIERDVLSIVPLNSLSTQQILKKKGAGIDFFLMQMPIHSRVGEELARSLNDVVHAYFCCIYFCNKDKQEM